MPGGVVPSGQSSLQTVSGVAGYYLLQDARGHLDAGRIDPGRYTVVVEFPNGWYTHHRVVVRPGEKRVEKIVCPQSTEKAFVTITAPPLPEDLRSEVTRPDGARESGTQIHAALKRSPQVIGRVKWYLMSVRPWDLSFDPVTGQLTLVMESSRDDSSAQQRNSFRD